MLTPRRLFILISLTVIFAAQTLAQAGAPTQLVNAAPTVANVSVSPSEVRFAVEGQSQSMRVEVYSASGELVFDSGFQAGGELRWNLLSRSGGTVADGSYRCKISVKDAAGQVQRQDAAVQIENGQAPQQDIIPQPSTVTVVDEGITFTAPAGGGTYYRDIHTSDNAGGLRFYSSPSLALAPTGAALQFWGNNSPFPGQAFVDSGAQDNAAVIFRTAPSGSAVAERMRVSSNGNVGIGTSAPAERLEVAGNVKLSGANSKLIFADGTSMTTASAGNGAAMTGTGIVTAINDPATSGSINDTRLSSNVARLNGANVWSGVNVFSAGLSASNAPVSNVGAPTLASDAANKNYVDSTTVRFAPTAQQVSVGDANGTAPMVNLRGGSTCCSGPGGYTSADFKVFQNGSFVATGNLGIGVSPMEGKGYRTSWHTYKGAFRSGYADNEWDDANTGFFSWAGGSNSTASGLYAFAFGDTNFASSTSSIAFGSGNEVKGAAGFSAGAGNRVCDTYGVAFGNKAQSGGPLINGKCDPDGFNITGLAAVALGYNVTADKDHSTAMGKFASNNGFSGTFIWSDGSATASADTFRNTANNEFAARATGGFRFRTNLTGTTGCNLPAGSGVFNCTSSRYTKENFSLVSGDDVLARLRKVPVSTWNYISEGRQTRHLGPMAEDFYGAFGLGVGKTSIGVQDAVGVSLAAVKALDARTFELQRKTAEVEQLRSQLNAMELRLAALEQHAQTGTHKTAKRARR
ncbi:MAG: tail fiber domain-containing protein [Pyrinomonadaceae bacterium]